MCFGVLVLCLVLFCFVLFCSLFMGSFLFSFLGVTATDRDHREFILRREISDISAFELGAGLPFPFDPQPGVPS